MSRVYVTKKDMEDFKKACKRLDEVLQRIQSRAENMGVTSYLFCNDCGDFVVCRDLENELDYKNVDYIDIHDGGNGTEFTTIEGCSYLFKARVVNGSIF